MNVADVPATGLVQTGSRVSYYLYAAGRARGGRGASRPGRKAQLERGQRVDNLESGRPEVRGAIERAQRFLGLTALLAAILAGVAIALGTRRFVERHLDGCAVMRCFGATQAQAAARCSAWNSSCSAWPPAPSGASLGFVAQFVIAEILGGLLRADLPAASLLPAVQGFLVGLVLLLGFALPPLVQLKNVPAVRVIRRESGATRSGTVAVYVAGLGALSGLLIWQAGDLRLGVTVVGGFGVAVALFAVIAWLGLRFLSGSFFSQKNRQTKHCPALRPGQPAAARARQRDPGGEPRARASPRCCCSPSRATTWWTPGGAARRRMRPTASCSACSPTSSPR